MTGVVDFTFMDIVEEGDLGLCLTEYMNPSQPSNGTGSGSPGKKKKKENIKALRLGNNSISSLRIFESLPQHLNPSQIQWLDLSFNHIQQVDESLAVLFPNLTTLYLHANKLSKLTQIKKLAGLVHLKSLTLYGNPLEENKHYRNYVLYLFPELQQLDFSVITAAQREKMLSWSQVFRKSLNPEDSS